jgi:hypothetical protein
VNKSSKVGDIGGRNDNAARREALIWAAGNAIAGADAGAAADADADADAVAADWAAGSKIFNSQPLAP